MKVIEVIDASFQNMLSNARRSMPIGSGQFEVPGNLTAHELQALLEGLKLSKPEERSERTRHWAVTITMLEPVLARFVFDLVHEHNLRVVFERMEDGLTQAYAYYWLWIVNNGAIPK